MHWSKMFNLFVIYWCTWDPLSSNSSRSIKTTLKQLDEQIDEWCPSTVTTISFIIPTNIVNNRESFGVQATQGMNKVWGEIARKTYNITLLNVLRETCECKPVKVSKYYGYIGVGCNCKRWDSDHFQLSLECYIRLTFSYPSDFAAILWLIKLI